jgi:DsbC/DsbD-like thiol-disulfide interchange protein
MSNTPTTNKLFNGESYSFVTNESTKAKAETVARRQQKGHMRTRIVKWKRNTDNKTLYAVYIRRKKDFWKWYWSQPGRE